MLTRPGFGLWLLFSLYLAADYGPGALSTFAHGVTILKNAEQQASFPIFAGMGLTPWRQHGVLSEPGGGATLEDFRTLSAADPMVQAYYAGTAAGGQRKRWQKAQAAEARFWRTWRQNTLYQHVSLYDFWLEVVAKTGGELAPGRTLDVGCGPVSVLNFVRPKGLEPFGLDPLAEVYARENLIESRDDLQPMPIAGLPAEGMPFLDQSLDQVICFNVLDHVCDAPRVLAEIHRVLKPGGSLRLYVHTFAGWIKRFLFFDTPHTYHWDHQEFKALVEAGGFKVVHELMEPKTFDLPQTLLGKLTFFPYWVATKVAYTSYFKVERL